MLWEKKGSERFKVSAEKTTSQLSFRSSRKISDIAFDEFPAVSALRESSPNVRTRPH
jgi:hypothetical protein